MFSPAGNCCGCDIQINVLRDVSCPVPGATVVLKDGGTTLDTQVTESHGVAHLSGGMPGHTYTIDWSWEGESGTFTGIGCGANTRTVATPAGSHFAQNCPDELPDLYVTDVAGTHKVWPTTDCYTYTPSGGITQYRRQFLTADGSCAVSTPAWSLHIVGWGDACDGSIIISYPAPNNTFNMSCARPISYSGTYPTFPTGHPHAGTAFLLHE